jgi:hypothetical protein
MRTAQTCCCGTSLSGEQHTAVRLAPDTKAVCCAASLLLQQLLVAGCVAGMRGCLIGWLPGSHLKHTGLLHPCFSIKQMSEAACYLLLLVVGEASSALRRQII